MWFLFTLIGGGIGYVYEYPFIGALLGFTLYCILWSISKGVSGRSGSFIDNISDAFVDVGSSSGGGWGGFDGGCDGGGSCD